MNAFVAAPALLMLLGYLLMRVIARRRRRQHDKAMLIPRHKIDVSERTGQFRR
jgi:cytochrome c-type biogenesis protein CcmH/NrfF